MLDFIDKGVCSQVFYPSIQLLILFITYLCEFTYAEFTLLITTKTKSRNQLDIKDDVCITLLHTTASN